jgi:hypothetical protein
MIVPDGRFLVRLGKLDPKAAAPLTDAALTPYHAIKSVLEGGNSGACRLCSSLKGV